MRRTEAVRFVTAVEDGDDMVKGPPRAAVSRIEGDRLCPKCERLHAYQLGRIPAGPDDESEPDELFDSYEDAAHQVREWLPDAPRFLARRETGRDADATVLFFANRVAAIEWLLEPL